MSDLCFSCVSLTRFSKFFSFLLLFAVSVKWAKSGGGIKIEIWHENGRHESSESLDHTILHRISVRPERSDFFKGPKGPKGPLVPL